MPCLKISISSQRFLHSFAPIPLPFPNVAFATHPTKLAGLLLESLESDLEAALSQVWADEAQARSKALAAGKLKTVSVQKAFGFKA